ncbi:hypothetical protein BH09PSE4_BH09PSE4_22170 [soil metagenome]
MDQFSNDPFTFLSSEDVARQRHDSRDSLFLIANVRIGTDDAIQVRVRNLSAGGLMAEYTAPIQIGTPIDVEVRGVGWVAGRIAWVAEGRIGVAFEQQIDPMLARKPVGAGPKTTPFFQKPIAAPRPPR